MAEILVVRLLTSAPSDPARTAEWLVIDTSGVRRGNVHVGVLEDVAAHCNGRKVIALVPGTEVLLAEPVLPVKSGAKLAQVVPFALEEQLATDIERLHFAVGRRDSRSGTPVAVTSHTRMESWQALLRNANLHAEALYAETAALPVTPNGVTLLVDVGRVYVRRESTPGAVLEVEPLIEALQLALASGDEAREHVTIYVTEEGYERERELLEGLREFTASLQLKLLPDGPLPLLAANVLQSAPVNLLQGRYATKTKLNVSFAPWRYAALLAVVFFALHLGVKGWQFLQLKRTEARLDGEIAQVFQQALPGAPVPGPLEARKQVELRLNQLRGSAPVSGMMVALGTLSEALTQAPDTRIDALSYRNNVTDLRVLAPSVEALDRIRQIATEHGISAEIQSTSPRESKIEGRLQFKGTGA